MDKARAHIERDAPYVNVLVEPHEQVITIRWKNYAPSGTYRATLDLAVDLINEHQLRYFLTDQRRRGAILHEDEVWLTTDWAPRMARAGLERAAIVQSPDFFKTMEEARAWLMSGELEMV
jgi:hypothetical protein